MEGIIEIILEQGWYNFLWKPVAHFVLSGGVGWLVYFWTSTTLRRWHSGPRLMKGAFSIRSFSLLLALSFAVLAHTLEDYTLNWF